MPAEDPNPACVASLRALVDGRLADYTPLDRCSKRDVDDAFGASEPSSGALGPSWRSSAPGQTERTIEAVYNGTSLMAVLVKPRWTADALAVLGTPDEEVPSPFSPAMRQRTWASRGLIAHVDVGTNQIWLVAAFRTMALEVVRGSPMYNIIREERVLPPPVPK